MRLRKFVTVLGLLVLVGSKALAQEQEDKLGEAIGLSLSGTAYRDLQAQASAAVPEGGTRGQAWLIA